MRGFLSALVLLACAGSSPGASDAASDVATTDVSFHDVAAEAAADAGTQDDVVSSDVTTDTSDGGGACSTMALPPDITAVGASPQAAPTPAGGTIVPGLYYLTAATWYDGSVGTIGNVALAWNITSTEIDDVDDEMGSLRRENDTYTAVGTDLTLVMSTCPTPTANGTVDHYTATATTLDLFWTDGSNDTVVFELTKQ